MSIQPVYARIADALIRDIAAGRLLNGARLPPERDMAGQFDTSVGTLRKALAILEQQALLRRVQGSGNYIDAAGMRDTVYAMFRLELPDGGGLPRATVLSVDTIRKPDDLPAFGTAREATRIRRRRRLDDTEIAVEEIWLDADAGLLTAEQITASLYETYRDVLGLWIDQAEDRVTLATLPAWTPSDFNGTAGDTVGYIERFTWGEHSDPVEFSRTWYLPDQAVYVQRLR